MFDDLREELLASIRGCRSPDCILVRLSSIADELTDQYIEPNYDYIEEALITLVRSLPEEYLKILSCSIGETTYLLTRDPRFKNLWRYSRRILETISEVPCLEKEVEIPREPEKPRPKLHETTLIYSIENKLEEELRLCWSTECILTGIQNTLTRLEDLAKTIGAPEEEIREALEKLLQKTHPKLLEHLVCYLSDTYHLLENDVRYKHLRKYKDIIIKRLNQIDCTRTPPKKTKPKRRKLPTKKNKLTAKYGKLNLWSLFLGLVILAPFILPLSSIFIYAQGASGEYGLTLYDAITNNTDKIKELAWIISPTNTDFEKRIINEYIETVMIPEAVITLLGSITLLLGTKYRIAWKTGLVIYILAIIYPIMARTMVESPVGMGSGWIVLIALPILALLFKKAGIIII